MLESDDMTLLCEYASSGSEAAFAALVSRYIDLVYSVAFRHVRNASQAEEVSQIVFMLLARKAGQMPKGTVLSGWLYSTTRLTAANYVRSEIRRRRREQEAQMQHSVDPPDAEVWEQLSPHLDEAMSSLSKRDRDFIVLRFFGSKSFQQVGAILGTSEPAAKMRVSRAVEKLRKLLASRGVAFPAAVLCGAISAHAVQAAPVAVAASITASVLQGSTVSVSLLTVLKGTLQIMAWTKAKTAITVAVGALLVTGSATYTIKKIIAHGTYPWQVQNVNTGLLNQVPPQVRIVPTKFPNSGGGVGSSVDKVLGINQPVQAILVAAYGGSSSRLVLNTQLPGEKYDFIANLPQGSLKALQDEIKRKFALIAHHETRETNVLRLAVKAAGADGLRPSQSQGGSARSGAGQFSCVNQPISSLIGMLQQSFGMPIVDQTALNGRYDIDLRWDETDFQKPNREALKQALGDELGLELIPATEPIEMLVVQRSS